MAQRRRAPGRTLLLEPWVFADEWPNKPPEAICVGLRLLADTDKTKARFTAEEMANETHPLGKSSGLSVWLANWTECFNDCLIRQVSALAICDPNDVSKPHELFPYAEAQVMEAFTSRGALFVFESLDRYEVEVSPIGELADHSELTRLAALLPHVEPGQLAPGLRRLISHVVEELDLRFGDSVDVDAVDHAPDELAPLVLGKIA
jgi:hypothetical protein